MIPTTLNAWSVRRYGGPEALEPVTCPMPEPGAGEVLIRIRASAVTRADTMMRAGRPRFARLFLGLTRPRNGLIGTGLSGEVIAVGDGVSRFRVGDGIFGEAGMAFGANSSHICLDENGILMPKPENLSHEHAAVMCDGPLTSLNFLQNIAGLRAQERVLILGASGSLGTVAVQVASAMGAEVTGTCSARNAEMVASLGADHVIDYTSEDFRKGTTRYDVIYDAVGASSFGQARSALTETGRYVCPVLSLTLLAAMLGTSVLGGRRARFSATGLLKPEKLRQMLGQLIEMTEAGKLTPVMDKTYPLEQLVDAHRYVDTGRKRGNVVMS